MYKQALFGHCIIKHCNVFGTGMNMLFWLIVVLTHMLHSLLGVHLCKEKNNCACLNSWSRSSSSRLKCLFHILHFPSIIILTMIIRRIAIYIQIILWLEVMIRDKWFSIWVTNVAVAYFIIDTIVHLGKPSCWNWNTEYTYCNIVSYWYNYKYFK